MLDTAARSACTPTLRVSVVVPAYGGQDKLDLALAGLAAQTYPAGLIEVIVVDNGSSPPLRLPENAPRRPADRLRRRRAGPTRATPGSPRPPAT